MSEHTRREFLGMAGAGAVAVGTAAIAVEAVSPPAVPDSVMTPLVAYVRDAGAGEIAVLAGEREVVVVDRELAARIAHVLG